MLCAQYFVNCPAVIYLPSMLVMFYGDTPLVNYGPRSTLLHLINTTYCNHCFFSFSAIKHHFPHHTFNPLFSARPVRLTTSLFRWGKANCLSVCRFHVVADAGSAPCHKSASNNLQKCSLPPTGPIKPWFLTEGKLLLCYIIPSSWGLPTDV